MGSGGDVSWGFGSWDATGAAAGEGNSAVMNILLCNGTRADRNFSGMRTKKKTSRSALAARLRRACIPVAESYVLSPKKQENLCGL